MRSAHSSRQLGPVLAQVRHQLGQQLVLVLVVERREVRCDVLRDVGLVVSVMVILS